MTVAVEDSASPPPELLFKRRVNLRTSVREILRAGRVMRALAERDVRSRY